MSFRQQRDRTNYTIMIGMPERVQVNDSVPVVFEKAAAFSLLREAMC